MTTNTTQHGQRTPRPDHAGGRSCSPRSDVAGIVWTWGQARIDLTKPFVEQGRRWQALDLAPHCRRDVDRYVTLVDEEPALVEQILAQILALAEELKAWTIEALLAMGDEQLGLEALLGRQR